MAAILNLAILESAILVFPLKLTHTCQDWFQPFAQKHLHSFILTELDDGSHLDLHCGIQDILFSSLRFTQKHSHSTLALTQTNSNLIQTHSFSLNLMMVAILNLAILDSGILVFPLKPTHICQDWFPPFAQKSFTHSFSLTLMMAAILNSAMFDSDPDMLHSNTLLSSLSYTQKHSPSTLILTQTNSIWLKLIHSHLNWCWQPSWILPSWIPPS